MMFDDVQLRKVNQPASFTGCLFNVVYNGVALPLWQSVLRTESHAVCCRKSSTQFPSSVSTLPGVSFYGFGYVSYYNEPKLLMFSDSLGLKLKFRTFAPDAVIMLLASVDSSVADYCGVFLNGGKLQWNVVSDSGSVSVETQQVYNTGNWYEVRPAFSSVKNYASSND